MDIITDCSSCFFKGDAECSIGLWKTYRDQGHAIVDNHIEDKICPYLRLKGKWEGDYDKARAELKIKADAVIMLSEQSSLEELVKSVEAVKNIVKHIFVIDINSTLFILDVYNTMVTCAGEQISWSIESLYSETYIDSILYSTSTKSKASYIICTNAGMVVPQDILTTIADEIFNPQRMLPKLLYKHDDFWVYLRYAAVSYGTVIQLEDVIKEYGSCDLITSLS